MYALKLIWESQDKCNRVEVETYILGRNKIGLYQVDKVYFGVPFCNYEGYFRSTYCSKIKLRCFKKRLLEAYKGVLITTEYSIFEQKIKFVLKDIKIQSVSL